MTTTEASNPPAGPPVLVETSHDLPLVNLTVATRTGAAEEPPELSGLTRLLGRLMRRTAGGRDPHALDAQIDRLGASVGADVNHSSLGFHATVIARSLDGLIDLMSDMLSRPVLDGEELERLRRETQSELVDVLDNDRALVRRWCRRHLFGDHPYGRSTVGTSATVQAWSPAPLHDWHRRFIVSDNLVFAFAGDIDAEQARSAVSRLLEGVPVGVVPQGATTEPVPQPGRRLLIVDKPERSQTQILIGAIGTKAQDDDHTALLVANTIFGGTFSARMTREIRAERGWSYGAYSSLPIDRHRQAFSMWTFPKATDAAPCIQHQLQMLEKWREEGVTDEELAWAKSYLVKSHAFAVDTASKRLALALDEELYDLPDRYHEDYLDRVQAVTREQANAAVRRRIDPSSLAIVVVGTAADIRADVEAVIDPLDSTEVVPFDAEP